MSVDQKIDSLPTRDDFESLLVNNKDMDSIRSHLGRFNPIKTMGMERMEIRHSAILAWLLSPQETHGLGDKFLKAFVSEALRGKSYDEGPSALDVSQADMMDAEVRREWMNIDILILSPNNGWVFLIENKFDSKQHSDQLQRYLDIANSVFMKGEEYKVIRGIFLTLWGEYPDNENYTSIEYSSICDLLGQVILSGQISLSSEVRTFLNHYYEIILEATGMSDEQKEMEKLARQIYRNHRQVFDFVIEHGKSTDFTIACEKIFGVNLNRLDNFDVDGAKYVFNASDSQKFSFLPSTWFDAFGRGEITWTGCENWWASLPVIMWFQLTTDHDGGRGQIRIYAEIGPLSVHDLRRKLIEEITLLAQEKDLHRIIFQKGAADEGKKYSKFFKGNSFPVDDINDHEKIAQAMLKALKTFKTEIEEIGQIFLSLKL